MNAVTDLAVARAERGLESQYQRHQARRDAQAQRISIAEDGLRAELQQAIKARGWVQIVTGPSDTLERVHVAELLSDEMGSDELCALVLNALASSECELVKAARECFVRRVVNAHGSDLVTFGFDGESA